MLKCIPLAIRVFHISFEFFGWNYPFYGGFGIALLRLLFIKFPMTIHDLRPNFLMGLMVFSCNATCVLTTYLYISNLSKQVALFAECLEPSQNSKEARILITTVIFITAMLVVLSEFVIYVMACWSVYKSDLNMVNALSNQVIKKRIRRNAISLLGKLLNILSMKK